MKLTPKQKAFADEYLICGNATDTARKAGYNPKSASRNKKIYGGKKNHGRGGGRSCYSQRSQSLL